MPTPSACSRRTFRAISTTNFRPLPYGYNSVSVYTDESGEANVNFVPGLGMYFDNLGGSQQEPQRRLRPRERRPDRQGAGRRRLRSIRTSRSPLPGASADPVNFTVHNLFKKTLTVYSKGVDKNNIVSNSVAKIVLAHAQDIDGSPLAYELVCWMADSNAAGFRVFAGDLPAPTAADPNAVDQPRSVPRAVHARSRIRSASAGCARSRIGGATRRSRSSTRTRPRSTSSPSSSTRASSATRSRTSGRPRSARRRDHER